MLEILYNLIDDGYLRKINDGYPQGNTFYAITFKGRFFESRGGYKTKLSQDDDEKLRKEAETMRVQKVDGLIVENAKKLNHLTLFLGVATFCAAAPLVMEYYEKHFLDKISFLYFLSGLLLGMLIWWLISKLLITPRKTKVDDSQKNI